MNAAGRARPAAGVSVFKLLGAAAVVGGVAGALLARRGADPDHLMDAADREVDRVLPVPSAGPRRPVNPPDMMAADPVSLRGIPAYPGATPRRVTSSMPRDGQLNAISWFTTPDNFERVLSYYEEAYTRANIMHVSHRWPRRGYVSWFEHNVPTDGGRQVFGDGVLHMVSAMNEGSQTIVMLSATEPAKMLEAMSPLPPGVKLPTGAGRPQVINLGEPGDERSSVFAQFSRGREEVAEDVERQLAADGWRVEGRTVADDGEITIVARQEGRLQTAAIKGTLEHAELLLTLEQSAEPTGAPQ